MYILLIKAHLISINNTNPHNKINNNTPYIPQ